MKYVIEVAPYTRTGLEWEWDSDWYALILVREGDDGVHIRGDRVGLTGLAKILLTLAQENVPDGVHVHLDPGDHLAAGSVPIVLERWSKDRAARLSDTSPPDS